MHDPDIVFLRVLAMVGTAVCLYFWQCLRACTKDSTNIPAIRLQTSLGWLIAGALAIQVYITLRITYEFL